MNQESPLTRAQIMIQFRAIRNLKHPAVTRKVQENAFEAARWIFNLKLLIFEIYPNTRRGIVIVFNDRKGMPHILIFNKGHKGVIGVQSPMGEVQSLTPFKSSRGLKLNLIKIAKG